MSSANGPKQWQIRTEGWDGDGGERFVWCAECRRWVYDDGLHECGSAA